MRMITQFALVISAIMIREGICSIKHVCLVWHITSDTLILTCTVRNLIHSVLIYDPADIELGHCFEPVHGISCNSTFSNGTMTQNISTNVTELSIRGRIDTNLNGKWRCTHGTNVGEATVEVTVPEMNEKNVPLRCTNLPWALIPFICGCGLALFVLWATERKQSVNRVSKIVNECSNGITKECRCLICIKVGKCMTITKIITTLIAGILVIIIPNFTDCSGFSKGMYVGLGSFLGCIVLLLVCCRQDDTNENMSAQLRRSTRRKQPTPAAAAAARKKVKTSSMSMVQLDPEVEMGHSEAEAKLLPHQLPQELHVPDFSGTSPGNTVTDGGTEQNGRQEEGHLRGDIQDIEAHD